MCPKWYHLAPERAAAASLAPCRTVPGCKSFIQLALRGCEALLLSRGLSSYPFGSHLPLQSAPSKLPHRSTTVEKVRVMVGSIRRPKLGAVEAAIHDFGPLLAPGSSFEVIGAEVESGVGHTPTNRNELM